MIVVDNVSKYYGARPAVRELSFQIGEGECVGFLGLNGAGKSTTLRLLSCLLLPTEGRITVRGLDVVDRPHEIRKLIGYLPDSPPLYLEMSVLEYLEFAGRLRGLAGAELIKRRNHALGVCNLEGVVDQPLGTLSHGYRQRVGIAQAIIHGPALLILDEPIQGLDPVQIVEMRKMIGELRGEHTILLSTHILTEIEQTCDRILMMHEGRIAAQGNEAELAAQLGTGRALELDLRGELPRALEVVRGVAGVAEASGQALEAGLVRVSARLDGAAPEAVSRAVIQAGLGLCAMQSVSTGLEAVFLRLSAGHGAARSQPAQSAGSAA
jgi:ABC-2 type transport system ATP-binding protein